MPVWLRALGRWGRQHPGVVALLVALGGLVGYWQLQPARPPTPRPTPATAQPFTGTLPGQVSLESALATVQRENEQLKQILAEQQRTLARLDRDQQTRQQDAAAQAQRLEATLRQALATAELERQRAPAPTPAAAPGRPPAPPKPPPVLRILRPATEPAPPPAPSAPPVPAPTWVQLTAGSFVRGRLLTGLFATTHAGGALPALFAVREAFTGPNQTAIPLQGCLALGKAQADLASLRAIVQLTTLACVWPDGQTFEHAVAGYVTGRDGTLGLPGRLEQRAGAYLGRTFLASLVAGAAEAFAAAERTTQITPLGGSQSVVTGDTGTFAAFSALATASARVADFYLGQAEQLVPVVWVPAAWTCSWCCSRASRWRACRRPPPCRGPGAWGLWALTKGDPRMRPSCALTRCVLLAPLALAACTRVTALEGPPQDLHTVYTESLAAPRQPPTLQAKPLAVGPEAPYTPVMQPPQIQRVWVPDQRNSTGDLVSGHWVYLLLERSQ